MNGFLMGRVMGTHAAGSRVSITLIVVGFTA